MFSILIIDDNTNTRHQWEQLLVNEGFSVIGANDSKEAFSYLTQQKFDLIILELFLGTEHGLGIIQRLQQEPQYNQIPIMVVSADRRRSSIEEVINAGIIDYLIKPVKKSFLLKRIKRIALRGQKQAEMVLGNYPYSGFAG